MTVIKHASVGSTMTQTEFVADELHTVDGSTSYTFLTSTGGTFTGDVTVSGSLVASSSASIAGGLTTVIKKFALNTSIADHSYSGETLSAVAYQAIAITDVCRLNSAGQWAIADASTESTAAGLPGMATAAASSGATLICLTDGLMRDDDGFGGAMTIGATYFLSETAGDVTATRPSTTGAIVRAMGYAQAARVFYFKPSPYFHEVTT